MRIMNKDQLKEMLKEMLKNEEIKFEQEYFEWGGVVTYIIIDDEKFEIL